MKPIILFLDIDGVFNANHKNRIVTINKKITRRFVEIIHRNVPIKIVWSTSNRILVGGEYAQFQTYQDMLERYKLHDLYPFTHEDWMTPSVHTTNRIRGDEVQAWLENHLEDFSNYLCIDDDSDFHHWQLLYQTYHGTGLTITDVNNIERILNYMDGSVTFTSEYKQKLYRDVIYGRNTDNLRKLMQARNDLW